MTARILKSISAIAIAGFSIIGLSALGHLTTSPTAIRPALMPVVDVAVATPLVASSMPRLADNGDNGDDRNIAPGQDYDQGGQRANHGEDCSFGGFGGRGGSGGSFGGGDGGSGGDGGPNGNGGDGGDGGSFDGGDGGGGGSGGLCAA